MKPPEEVNYTKEERVAMLEKMRRASDAFYYLAQQTHCHPFLEFTGLINEYITICHKAHLLDVDFTMTSIHTGKPLPIDDHNVAYLGEKLGCIYGSSLDEDKARKLVYAITGLPIEESSYSVSRLAKADERARWLSRLNEIACEQARLSAEFRLKGEDEDASMRAYCAGALSGFAKLIAGDQNAGDHTPLRRMKDGDPFQHPCFLCREPMDLIWGNASLPWHSECKRKHDEAEAR